MIKRNKTLLKTLALIISLNSLYSITSFADNNIVSVDNTNNNIMLASEVNYTRDNNGLKWSYKIKSDNTIAIRLMDKPAGTSLEFPSKLDGYTVSALDDYALAFVGVDLTSVKIPSTVTTLGKYALNANRKLANIEIPSSVKNFGEQVFEGTVWLQEKRKSSPLVIVNNVLVDGKTATGDITIPSNVTSIAHSAFSYPLVHDIPAFKQDNFNAAKITSVTIPSSVKFIDEDAFRACQKLAKVNIEGKSKLGDYSFANCPNLSEVNMPSYDMNLTDYFFNTPWLQDKQFPDGLILDNDGEILSDASKAKGDIIIPSTVKYIDENAFSNAHEVTSVTIPSSVEIIWQSAFAGCKNLKTVTIEEGVSQLSGSIFEGCENLEKINLPSTITKMGRDILANCPKLKDVKLSANIKTLPSGTFRNCSSLKEISLPDTINEIDHGAFKDSGLSSIHISNNIKKINSSAFIGCKNLTSINIPSSVESIGGDAFAYCYNLKKVTFDNPLKITNLYNNTFAYCKGLEEFEVPNGITSISTNAFYGCESLKTLKIPSTVKEISDRAFDECNNLKTIYAENDYVKQYFNNKNVEIKSYTSTPNTNTSTGQVVTKPNENTSSSASSSDQGWKYLNNNWYYKDSQGKNYTGWVDINNKTYYFYGDGTMATSFVKLGDSTFYFDPANGSNQGASIIGWKLINNKWYYFTPAADSFGHKGKMQTGWLYDRGTWYYLYSDGTMATEFINLGGGAFYYLNPSSGAMITGWKLINGKWYYFNPTNNSFGYEGMMAMGWRQIGGVWYYFYSDGKMAANTWIGNYYVNKSGAWVSTR